MPTVTIYSKPDCHLCDEAKTVIERVRQRINFEFRQKNILDDPRDFANYRYAIPVIFVEDREIARYRLNEEQLLAALRS
jgi:glutaredoxin